jgi:hypothetical protein
MIAGTQTSWLAPEPDWQHVNCLADWVRHDLLAHAQLAWCWNRKAGDHAEIWTACWIDGRSWFASTSWSLWAMKDGNACGGGTPIDAYRSNSQGSVFELARAGLLRQITACAASKALRRAIEEASFDA